MDTIDWTDFANYASNGGRLNAPEHADVIAQEPTFPTYQFASDLVHRASEDFPVHVRGMDEHARVAIAKLLGTLPYDHEVVSRPSMDSTRTRRLNEPSLVVESYLMRGLNPTQFKQAYFTVHPMMLEKLRAKPMQNQALEGTVYNIG